MVHSTVVPDTPVFACRYCTKPFLTRKRLANHERRHARKYSGYFTCPAPGCGRTFTTKQNLAHHVRGKHSDQVLFCTECKVVVSRKGWASTGYQHVRTSKCSKDCLVWMDRLEAQAASST